MPVSRPSALTFRNFCFHVCFHHRSRRRLGRFRSELLLFSVVATAEPTSKLLRTKTTTATTMSIVLKDTKTDVIRYHCVRGGTVVAHILIITRFLLMAGVIPRFQAEQCPDQLGEDC